jgi:HlyD family secretion protein
VTGPTRGLPTLVLVAACVAPATPPLEPGPTDVTRPRVVQAPPHPAELVAVVTSRRSAVISSQTRARIETLTLRPGQIVKAGERVAELNQTELRTKLELAKADERAAAAEAAGCAAQVAGLTEQLTAERHLYAQGFAPRMAVVNLVAQLGQAQGQAGAAAGRAIRARVSREQAEGELARAEIGAPIDGVVTNVAAREGEVAQIGSPIARVFDPSDLIIRFAVPRELRARLQLGQRVELDVDGNQRPLWAVITQISAAQEPPINFSIVEADVDDARLAPGELTVATVGRVRIADARGAKP